MGMIPLTKATLPSRRPSMRALPVREGKATAPRLRKGWGAGTGADRDIATTQQMVTRLT